MSTPHSCNQSTHWESASDAHSFGLETGQLINRVYFQILEALESLDTALSFLVIVIWFRSPKKLNESQLSAKFLLYFC